MIAISTDFEAGKIRVVACDRPDDIVVELEDDTAASVRQWFFFRLTGAKDCAVRITFRDIDRYNANKGLVGMPTLWDDYNVLGSYDLDHWFPVATEFRDGHLFATVTPSTDSLYLANFAPYSSERLARFIGTSLMSPRCGLERLGQSVQNRAIECLRIGEPGPGRKTCWVITRQHPAETQGTWCVEGLVERLLDENDASAIALLDRAVFYIVPNMNPDGSVMGNTRTNATGRNLNREWPAPSPDEAPEVYWVRKRMTETGMDFGLDIHAWTGPHNFAIGPYHTPSVTDREAQLWLRYEAALAAASSEFETGWPYPGGGPEPGKADQSISWNHFFEAFGAFGVLYELLYKNNACNPDPANGWTAGKCKRFGHDTVDAIAAIVDVL
ncbi:M14 family metallopeptidase [Sphingosinicella microcystinivorans]|uniref:M14 family metallopeptidase n=1 Tax=Sphingosinicella microcystinivorans TaxID=335406 RepID=UPI0022F38214|nr:M14-type cytosolic carboxypeptidase [Sphingosinicella microcystinivorans]WBX84169.1 M14-type cytosolic carboxypeptidase [Sphingosinicella microcystinivorans]